ncbi:MAG: peptide chain release factor N(5)-glutamine methyltransferase [Candidatus Zixiibacteriota bacterium]
MNVLLLRFITEKARVLEAVGIKAGKAEVELILCYLLNCDRLQLFLNGYSALTDDLLERFDAILERRATRYPLQYILGESWFYGRRFSVNPAVMVPTPETELLCEAAIGYARRQKYIRPRILDIGVGSGVISVTLANELPNCSVVALDLSPDAIAVARQNALMLGGSDRIEFRHSDFFAAVHADERFDLILSNPPYISDEEYKHLPPEVMADPKLALTSGEEGLNAVKQILKEAPLFLAGHGRLMFEIGYNQAERVAQLTEQDSRFKSIVILKDLNDIDRVVMLSCDE